MTRRPENFRYSYLGCRAGQEEPTQPEAVITGEIRGKPADFERLKLAPGKSHGDGSTCVMSRGRARRVRLSCAWHLAELIADLEPNQAITSGTLRADLGDELTIVPKAKLNGGAAHGIIARTAEFFDY